MYIDGFVIPVPSDRKDEYIAFARKAAAIFRENGATQLVEAWADDVPVGERTSFTRAVELKEGESVVFAWITYPDKATRDSCLKATMSDLRLEGDVADLPFDGPRMIFGGFESVVEA